MTSQSSEQPASRYRDLVLLLLLGALWGSSYLFIKVTVAEVPAATLVAGRFLLAALIMWLLLLVSRQSMPRGRAIWTAYAVMGFLSGALPWTLITWGEQYIPSGLAALLQASMPIFTIIMAYLLATDEPITPFKIAGVLLGFVGVGILLLPDLRHGLQVGLLGQLAIIGASVSYAAAAIYARGRLRGQPPMASATGQLTMGLVYMLPVSLVVDWPLDISLSLPALASWLALTILGTVFAYIIYYMLIDSASATFVSTVTYVIPVNGLILGALVLGEPVNATLLLSLTLILAGVFLVRL